MFYFTPSTLILLFNSILKILLHLKGIGMCVHSSTLVVCYYVCNCIPECNQHIQCVIMAPGWIEGALLCVAWASKLISRGKPLTSPGNGNQPTPPTHKHTHTPQKHTHACMHTLTHTHTHTQTLKIPVDHNICLNIQIIAFSVCHA